MVYAGAAPAVADEATFKTDVNLVLLDVSVRDKNGALIAALPQEAFHVFQDGKAQPIVHFANVDVPVTAGLIVDASGSMTHKRPEVITAALSFIHDSNPQDEVFVVNFNDDVKFGLPVSQPFSDDIQQLRAALWMGSAEGRTRLYDAVLDGLGQLDRGHQARKNLIVITDGGDNNSRRTFGEVIRRVEQSGATIYTIGLFDEIDPDSNPRVLERMAHLSGGFAYFPKTLAEVPGVCRRIAKDIRSRYTIGYIPPTNRTGLHHIRVEVNAPAGGNLIARTRTVYAMPSQTADKDSAAKP